MEHGRRERPSEQPARKSRKHRCKGGIAGKIFGVLGTLILIGVCTTAMIAGIFMKYVETSVIPTVEVRAEDYTMALSSFIYYQDKETGEWVSFQTVHGEENRVLAEYDEIPDALWQAAVAIEDERFFQHNGVDWKRTAKATLNIFSSGATFGGSTITQQVLKNMTGDKEGTINRKVREIFRALEFEKNYTKEQILTLYLNTIYLGKGCYGVKTAAEYYFGKELKDLSVAECASLIAITNNPSLYGPMYDITYTREDGTTVTPRELNKNRQELILDKMAEVGVDSKAEDGVTPFLTKEEAEVAKAEVLQFTDGDATATAEELVTKAVGGVEINSWFVDEVIRDVSADLSEELGISVAEARLKLYNSGYPIYTTLDPDIQAIAESVYEDRSNLDVTSRSGQKLQSGITIIEPSTGNVVATVGKIGEKTGNLDWSFATTSKRQVGSSIKPLTVYAPAIDAGAVTPGTAFDDYPVRELNGNPWPKNSPNKYRGRTLVQTGLQHSINTIAVQTLQAVGEAESFAFATEKLNLSLVADDMNLAALGLGGLTHGLDTMEMAAAYACFANNGIYNEPRTYLKVEDSEGNVILENESESHVAMKETTAYLMNQMLKSVITGGTGTSAKFGGMTIAGKTGTTSDNYDRYFVGYTPYYVAAVWTGYEQPEKISYSGNPAITMWKKVMQQVHADLPNKDFDKPASGLATVKICQDSGLLCTDACHADSRGDRAITVTVAAGTAPTESCTLHAFRDYCTEGQCLATESCPAESVVQKAFLDYTRTDYGESITAADDAYLISNLEKALKPQAPTEENPNGTPGGCPVHNGMVVDPDNPDDSSTDPSDPNYNPPDPNGEGGNGGENPGNSGTGEAPTEPTAPTTPAEPSEPTGPSGDPSGGDGDWWNSLWNTTGN